MENLLIIGAGGLGREIAAMVKSAFADKYRVIGFIDDGLPSGSFIDGVKVLGGVSWLNGYQRQVGVIIAIGEPNIKAQVRKNIKEQNVNYPNLIHPNARLHDVGKTYMGVGNIIADGCILTTNIRLGDFNLINLSCTIGHDVEIGNFCSIMPGVNVSGATVLKNEIYVGTGAKLINGITVNTKSTIGAGAVVTTNVPSGNTFVGVPAKEINHDQ